jgi:YegS/Rv2252/BmrU family lipid kinase
MRRVAVIYNPFSGQHSVRRAGAMRDAMAVLSDAGVAAEAFETDTPGSSAEHARNAAQQGFDTIIVCGGDGTVHEVLQSLVGTPVALGVVPLGTANALASDLGLIGSPAGVMRKLLKAVPAKIPVGLIHYSSSDGTPSSRYFTVAAGIGADALLMARMDPGLKRRLGYVLYLIEATRIWSTHNFPLFETAFTNNGDGVSRTEEISQLLAVRVRTFGGAVRELAPGATLRSGRLQVLVFKTRSRLSYMRFLLAVIAARHTFKNEIELVDTHTIECRSRNGSKVPIYVEADGEFLGSLPVRMEVVPDALNLLIPAGAQP